MQQGQNTTECFLHMIETKTINPMNPDLSQVPENIMAKFFGETLPDGKVNPTQAAVIVAYFLSIYSQIAAQAHRKKRFHKALMATKKEFFNGVERFLTLANLEAQKRAGFLKYKTSGIWHDEKNEILFSVIQPHPGLISYPCPETLFYWN